MTFSWPSWSTAQAALSVVGSLASHGHVATLKVHKTRGERLVRIHKLNVYQ